MNMADLTLSEASFGPGLLKSDSDADVFDDTKLQSTSSLQLNINHSQRIVDYNETGVSGAQDEDVTPTRTQLGLALKHPTIWSQIEAAAQQRTIPPIREIINAGLTAHSAQLEASSQVKPQIETVNAWIPIKLEQKHEFLTGCTLITSAGLWTNETISSGLNGRQSLEYLAPQSPQNVEAGSSSKILVSESHCASDVIGSDPITQPVGTSTQPAHPVKTVPSTPSEIKLSKSLFETYHGFIDDPVDAVYVVQGTLKGVLPAFRGNSDDMASVKVRSGTVIVMPEKGLSVKRWRDGIKWSPSRAYGNFLLYRQIETKNTNEPDDDDDPDPRPYSAPYGSTTGLQPTFTSKTLKEGTRIAKNGLTKRTITVKGSDGEKHRVISYYNSRDVMAMMRAAQRGEGGESLSAGLLRASEDENLRDAVKLSTADAIGLVKQLYPAFEVIVRQEVVKESPSKKVKLEGGVKLEDTIGPITAFTDP
ncbi:hypothetical protein HDU79_000370, partial [Rhizoclosmatium sp. JEL0117]